MDDFAAFARLIDALRPWLAHLTIIGGWAHRLHRFHSLARAPAYSPIRTKDADIAFSLSAPLTGDMAAALKAADFREEFSGEYTPPITEYRLGTDDGGFFVQFLAPLNGSGVKRSGQPDVTTAKAGVTAQKLRYLDLLLVVAWVVRVNREIGIPVHSSTNVVLPNPVSFIAQKLLIQKHRRPDKQAQDVLYIHDTLDLFGGELLALRELWQDKVRPALPEKTARAVERLQREQFSAVTDVIRNAVRVPQDRVLTPGRMQAASAYGLDEIFGK